MHGENRIKFALFHKNWEYVGGDPRSLEATAQRVPVAEYVGAMENRIFCPVCHTNLSRTPKSKEFFANGRSACYAHRGSFSHVDCSLRTPAAEGKRYLQEEDAMEAIAHDKLVIVDSFMSAPPERPDGDPEPYDQSAVEDIDGPIANVPIARHRGETFTLPSRITTVAGICRKFDVNFNKYYVFPGKTVALRLMDVLNNVKDVTGVSDEPALYFGKIIRSRNAGINPKPTNIRMTALECHDDVKDFHIKQPAWEQEEKNIDDGSAGKMMIFWGTIEDSGLGLAAAPLKWGEYALLPPKYNYLLE